MQPMQGPIFDATQYPPDQGSPSHPIGRFPFQISATDIIPTKANDGHMFTVEYSTPAGKVVQRFNLWNSSPQAVEIAHKQLSALCHAVGIYKIDMNTKGSALIGGRGMIDVRQQAGNTGYTEVGHVYDANGNEPGKTGQPQTAPAPAPAPFQPQQQPQQPQSGAPFQQQQPQGQPWNGAQPQGGAAPAPFAPAPAAPANQPWTQGGAPGANPPWAIRQ